MATPTESLNVRSPESPNFFAQLESMQLVRLGKVANSTTGTPCELRDVMDQQRTLSAFYQWRGIVINLRIGIHDTLLKVKSEGAFSESYI
jgi:hypothetical protein